jgi:hypothetical protein
MKKILLIVATLASGLTMNAQLTEANHAPANGDTYVMWQCDSVAPGAAGTNMVWNFASLVTHSSIVRTTNASTVVNASYPAATVSLTTVPNNLYSYFKSTTGNLNYYGGNISVGSGLSVIAAVLNYTAPALFATYPMSLGTTSSTPISGSLNVSSPIPASGTFTGTSSVIADGTGTLILPGTTSTYTNVIRVVSSQTINFTTGIASGSLNQVLYEYYAAGTKAPILSISTATGSAISISATQTIVTRNKNSVGISTQTVSTVGITNNEALALTNLNVYPNPSSSLVNFYTTHPEAQSVLVYDITGKQVEKLNLISNRAKLDVSSYNKGLYIYSLVSDNGKVLKSGKLTVSE